MIYTIGYGNRSIEVFINLLKTYQINYLIDIRSKPFSRNPGFQKERLKLYLQNESISYHFMGNELGGMPEDPSCYTQGKIDYAIVENKAFYIKGLEEIKMLSQNKDLKIALMCSELKFQNCHRHLLVGESLRNENISVMNIDEKGEVLIND